MGKGYQSTRVNILEDWNLQCALGSPVLQYDVNTVGSSSSECPMMEMRLGIKTDKNVTNYTIRNYASSRNFLATHSTL
jgi:hypothetical protein